MAPAATNRARRRTTPAAGVLLSMAPPKRGEAQLAHNSAIWVGWDEVALPVQSHIEVSSLPDGRERIERFEPSFNRISAIFQDISRCRCELDL